MISLARSIRRRLALAGALEAAWILGLSLFLGLLKTGYDPTRDAMSRLGEQGSLPPPIWNVGGFGVAALLYALYAIGIADRFGWRSFALATVLQSVTIAGSAVFNCERGCTAVHADFGLAYFAITCLMPFIAAWSFRRRDGWRGMMRGSLIVGALLVALFIAGPFLGNDRFGLWQRLVLFPALGWQAWVSIRIDRAARTISRPTPVPGR